MCETPESSVSVETRYGALKGRWRVSTEGRRFLSFEGVPYASPPVGRFRFREPQPLKAWSGTWDATRLGNPCLQYTWDEKIIGSEDCLYLNIYTPTLEPHALLPVIVLIPGGAYKHGHGGSYGPQHLMDRDIVNVNFNYRVGPLGFLSTGDEVVPGNMGLKDQVFALRWIQENINKFGGNPDNVTLTGLSAGASSVHYHYLSPMSKGTFARGIAFSGSALAPWALASRPLEKARALAEHLGCPTTSTEKMVDSLRQRPAESIVRAQTIFFNLKTNKFTITAFTPTIEPETSPVPFMTQHPARLAQGGQAAPVPLLASFVRDEGLWPACSYMAYPGILHEIESRWEELAGEIFFLETLPKSRRAEVARKIKAHYLGEKPVSQETFMLLVRALGDRCFYTSVGKMARLHALTGAPVYMYEFGFRGEKSLTNFLARNQEYYGVSHADDVFRLMHTRGMESTQEGEAEIRKLLVDIVCSFATTGSPKVAGVNWSPLQVGTDEITYLEITNANQYTMKSRPDFGEQSFWDSLGLTDNSSAVDMKLFTPTRCTMS